MTLVWWPAALVTIIILYLKPVTQDSSRRRGLYSARQLRHPMAPPSTPPKRSSEAARKSILGRLSLSPSLKEQQARSLSNVEPPLHVPQKSGSRIARSSDRIPSHAVAGPSYESMSPRPPPERATLSNGQNPYDAHPYHSSGGHDSAHMSRTFRPQSDSQGSS